MSWVSERAAACWSQVFGADFEHLESGMLQGHCPAKGAHTGKSARTDCRIFLDYDASGRKPGAFCQHESCHGQLTDLNRQFRDLIFADRGKARRSDGENKGVAPKPVNREEWIPDYDEGKLAERVAGVPEIGQEWFIERSPIDPRKVTGGEFLEHVFLKGERVLVFTEFFSQGNFLWEVGKGGFRLGDKQGVKAVRSALPTAGKEGVWYMCQPVDGQWYPNARNGGKMSRRSLESVQAFPHMVLESDEAPEGLWFRFLARLNLRIRAIYSSGGKSWHALVVVNMESKVEFDTFLRQTAKRILPVFGADPGALTPVRLTRLPACKRGGRLQKLIYLDPEPSMDEPLLDKPKRREVSA